MSRPTYERLAPGGPVSRVVNDIRDGKIDATGTLTFANGTTETEIRDLRLTEQSVLSLMPRSAAAAAAGWWVPADAKTRGRVVISHELAGADLVYDYTALG